MADPVLVAVPRFASVDEMISAIVLAQVLEKGGVDARVYFGHFNFPLRLQKLFPVNGLKLYMPSKLKHEFQLNLKLDDQVKSLRWEQSEGELRILVEMAKTPESMPGVSFSERRQFEKVYMIGAGTISAVESYKSFAKYTDTSDAELVVISCLPGIKHAGAGLVDPNLGSNSEAVLRYIQKSGLELELEQRVELLKGAHFARISRSGLAKPILTDLSRGVSVSDISNSNFIPELSEADLKSVYDFWGISGEAAYQVGDLSDFFALLRITPQLQPIPHLRGKKYEYVARAGDAKLIITSNTNMRGAADAEFSFRRLDKMLIGMETKGNSDAGLDADKPSAGNSETTTEPMPTDTSRVDIVEIKQTADQEQSALPESSKAPTQSRQKAEEYIPLRPASI